MYYRVRVFEIKDINNKLDVFNANFLDERRIPKCLGNIIVSGSEDVAKVMECKNNYVLDVFNKNQYEDNLLKYECIDFRKLREDGFQLFIFEEDMKEENIVSLKDVFDYINSEENVLENKEQFTSKKLIKQ